MNIYVKNWFKFVLGFVMCLLIRLIPFRPPNIEPILATAMPFSRAYGKTAGFLFAFGSMVLFDFIVGKVGVWTFITASAYGLVGFFAALYFKNKKTPLGTMQSSRSFPPYFLMRLQDLLSDLSFSGSRSLPPFSDRSRLRRSISSGTYPLLSSSLRRSMPS